MSLVPSPQSTIHPVTVSSPGSVIASKLSVYSAPSFTLPAPVTSMVGETLLTSIDTSEASSPLYFGSPLVASAVSIVQVASPSIPVTVTG